MILNGVGSWQVPYVVGDEFSSLQLHDRYKAISWFTESLGNGLRSIYLP
jgi:hypothetical protein